MSIEKTVKNQAKKQLCGNWIFIICGVIAISLVLIAAQCISDIIMLAFDAIDMNTFEAKSSAGLTVVLASLTMYAIVFLLSPLLNGLYKIVCNISLKKSAEITDLFYFFKNKRYLKTILLNFFLFAVFGIFSCIFNVSGYISYFLEPFLEENPSFEILFNIIYVLAWFISAAAVFTVYLVFVHYQLTAYAINDSLPIIKYAFGMYLFAFKNLGAALKLILSFIGWIALCFFVVPAFYVLPYLMTSMAVSAKWLMAIDGEWRLLLC